MGFNKKFFTTGGIVASTPPAAAGIDPFQNFETVTYTGNGGTQKITGYIRKGAAFNGTSSRISISAINGLSDVSVSCWLRSSNSTGTTAVGIIELNGDTSSIGYAGTLSVYYKYSDGLITIRSGNASNSESTILSHTDTTLRDGDWHNLIVTRNESSGVTTLYIDGSQVDQESVSQTSVVGGGTLIGDRFTGSVGNYNWDGVIDQVRIFNTAITDTAKIDQLAAEDYSKATKSTTDIFGDGSGVALYELDEDAKDTDGVDGKFNNAAKFNGTSSRINTNLVVNYSAFTASLWLYIPTGQSFVRILSNAPTGLPNPMINLQYGNPLSDDLRIQIYDGTTSVNVTKNNIPSDTWFHVAFTYTSGGTLKGYYNGVEFDSTSIATLSNTNTTPIYLGYNPRNNLYDFTGKIDQVRMYNSELSSNDISNLASETNIPSSNLLAHYKLDGNANSETGSFNGTESNMTYTGYNGTPTNVNFLGMAFQPDLVWTKSRSEPYNHSIYDSVRGVNKLLQSNTTIESTNVTNALNSFDSNGFTLGSGDNSNYTSGVSSVAWCWKAGGAAVSDTTTGDIDAYISANTAAGFSIVDFNTGTNSNVTVPHGLDSPPELIILKSYSDSSAWTVYAEPLGATKRIRLHKTDAADINSAPFNDTAPTSDVFTIGNVATYWVQNYDYIAYCFHSVDGYQKVGSYIGTGSAGNKQTIDFQPRFLLIKRTDSSSSWFMFDSTRSTSDPRNHLLRANVDNIEDTATSGVDFEIDGFSFNSNDFNESSPAAYIYLAIA